MGTQLNLTGGNDVTVYTKEGANTKVVHNNASSTGSSIIDGINNKNKPTKK